MTRFNNHAVRKNKLKRYAKLIIGCAIIVNCTTNSASAMLARMGKEGCRSLSRTSLMTVPSGFNFFIENSPLSSQVPFSRSYHVKPSLDKEAQFQILLSILIKEKSSFDLAMKLSEAASLGVEKEVIDVAKSFYDESKKIEATEHASKFKGIESSNTGC